MKVQLINYTPLSVAVKAIRTCWQSEDKGGCYSNSTDNIIDKDISLIDRVANKNKHASTIEHLNYTFDIDGVSRACLQELARHRIASLSVKSTRYTLKELKDKDVSKLREFLVVTGNEFIDMANEDTLWELKNALNEGIANDKVKYMLPEAYKTSLVWTINARSLQNFLELRTNKAALWEIRELAYEIFKKLPEDHKFLFEDCVYKEKESK